MKHSTLSLLICIGGCFSACSPTNEKVNPLTQHEDEITNIIAEMTLEEKINMLHGKNIPDRLCPCSYMEHGNGIQIRRGNGCRS